MFFLFFLGVLAGGCFMASTVVVSQRRENRSLRARIRFQTEWLIKLDEDFDRLSLDLAKIRATQESQAGPSEEELKRCEAALLDLLNRLIESPPHLKAALA